jgi:hypothetical protein
MTLPSLQPVNIQRLLKENTKIHDSYQYAKSITQGSIVASWHEAGPASSAQSANAKREQQEAIMQQQQVTQQRKQKLEQLLELERLALEAELKQQGLALLKHRD